MNQDAERIADRIRHLEEKEKAVKKLQRQAAKEHKRNEKDRKASQQLRDPAGFTGYLIASLAGAAGELLHSKLLGGLHAMLCSKLLVSLRCLCGLKAAGKFSELHV